MAKSNVQVMLTKDVTKLGKLGELVKVTPGYAQNYLLPQGLAVRSTPGIEREVERRKEKERLRLIAVRQEAENQKATLATIGTLMVKKAVGENNAIFGSVTDREVAELIKAKSMLEIDRRDVTVPEIKETGTYEVQIKLHAEVSATVKLQVVAE